MIDDNPQLKAVPKPFLEDILRWYATFAVMAVRRQADRDDDVLSLRRVLDEIVEHPECVCREMLVEMFRSKGPQYPPEMETFLIDSMWANFAKADGSLNLSAIQADIAQLDDISKAISRLANKTMAHTTYQGLAMANLPTFQDLDRCIDEYDQMTVKYTNLIIGASISGGSNLPVEQFDWTPEFHFAWKPRPAQ